MSNKEILEKLQLKKIYKKMEEYKIPPLIISKGKNKGKIHTNKKRTVKYCVEYCKQNNIQLFTNKQDFKHEYGEDARTNGLHYEEIISLCIKSISQITKFCGDITVNTNPNHIVNIWKCFIQLTECCGDIKLNMNEHTMRNMMVSIIQLTKFIGNITSDTEIKLLSNKKVESIYERKTTSKTDLIITNNGIDYPISVKMTNQGTQLHVSPFDNMKLYCEKNDIHMSHNVETVFKKFLGITKPTEEELKQLNMNRNERQQNKDRFWINELKYHDQLCIDLFIHKNKEKLIKFCVVDGLCLNDIHKPKLFILNKKSYTDTKIIDFNVCSYAELYKMISIGKSGITKNGNLELSKHIGVQRKGSGKTDTAKNNIQFKDRGLKYCIKSNCKYKGLSLFACSGISEYYLKDSKKLQIVLANELIESRAQIYRHFYPESKMITGDITKLYNNILYEAKELGIDFIIATPPCQSFSNAGKKDINDHRTPLFKYVINMIRDLKPKYVIIENVPSFMTSIYSTDTKETIGSVFNSELSNYNIKTRILNTMYYNTPQARRRSITLISRNDVKEWKYPTPCENIITVRDTIGHLPSLKNNEKSDIHKWHFCRNHKDTHILWMSHTPTGKTARENKIHYPKKDGRPIKGYATTYKRMEWDKPAPTITMSSGSISSQNNVHPGNAYIENGITKWDNPRTLSVYEIMLLTGLDDNWNPPTNDEKLMRDIIGESVPPKLTKALIDTLPLHTEV
jgi:DNA (cytosine-5)-methyltransferase 1